MRLDENAGQIEPIRHGRIARQAEIDYCRAAELARLPSADSAAGKTRCNHSTATTVANRLGRLRVTSRLLRLRLPWCDCLTTICRDYVNDARLRLLHALVPRG